MDAGRVLGLPPDAVIEPAPGGASGAAWEVRTSAGRYALRVTSSSRLADSRSAAMAAARAAGLPAPELIRRARARQEELLLLSWLPGTSMFEALVRDPSAARRFGRSAGELQRRLHRIAAPTEVTDAVTARVHPFDAGRDVPGLPLGSALLHLDWHPLNLLVDERERICGIVDWDNARRGHPLLDLARTDSLLRFAPVLLRSAARPAGLDDFRDGWVEGYGRAAVEIPAPCHLWAGRVMLADVEHRFADRPATLDDLRRWTSGWESSVTRG